MSRHDDETRLRHMLDHAVEAVEMCSSRIREDLDTDRMLNLSVVRLLEIVGEAASRVSESFRELHPEIEWRGIINLRHRIVHGYDAVDLDIAWRIIRDDLPPLIQQLEHIIAQ
jgi:uncharacterized protein with HEPN domain